MGSPIDSFGTFIEIERMQGQGAYVNGYYTPGPTKKIRLKAVVHPFRPKDEMLMPEGNRISGAFVVYTKEELVTSTEKSKRSSDIVTIYGEQYRVLATARWTNLNLQHYKAIVDLVNPPDKG